MPCGFLAYVKWVLQGVGEGPWRVDSVEQRLSMGMDTIYFLWPEGRQILTILCFIIMASPPGVCFAQLDALYLIPWGITQQILCKKWRKGRISLLSKTIPTYVWFLTFLRLDSPWRFPVMWYPMSHRLDLFQETQIHSLIVCSYLSRNSSFSDNNKKWTHSLKVSFSFVSLSLS